jgi:hypothetical protein
MSGYALEPITDNKINGLSDPRSRERVIGLGPGMELHATKSFWIYAHIYFETDVRNRPQGTSYVLQLSKTF